MPVVFDDETITRFAQQGEFQFASISDCIVDRLSLDIVNGTSIYTLPDYVLNIRRITWRGKKLDPISHRKYRQGCYPSSAQSEPTEYIYNNIGQQKIQFFPTPAETIAAATTNLYGSSIGTSVILEFSRTPDFASFVIPLYFRRFLLKCYVMKMCFGIESRGQNLKSVQYFDAKWEQLVEAYETILDELYNTPRMITASVYPILRPRPPRPVLPASFGTYVE
jgi:hypothetical protein